ncbi:MAG: nuclear transport factor 2 family protein [Chthoniobacterales bacterium]
MNLKFLLPFLASVTLAVTSFGADSAPPVAPDGPELTQLLKDFLAGASRDDLAMHDRFWAEDLIYTGSIGRRIGKADIMREVREEAAPKDDASKQPKESATYTAEDIRIQQYGTTAIVAFRLVGTTKKGETTEVANYLNSGTFLKRDGQWQVVNWQATKMPPEDKAHE